MNRMNQIKLKSLEKTKNFYLYELKKKDLTEKERTSYLLALKSIKKIIKEKERSGEKRKHKRSIAYDHKTVFQNSKSEH
ncbi:hypothetical protein ES705_40567 [subsurface metagenome]